MTPSRTVLAARLAMAGAVTSLVLVPLHGLARFNTDFGHGDLDGCCAAWWGRPGLDALHSLISWSDPYSVYLWYGRIWVLLIGTAAFCAFAVHAVLRPVNRTQAWAWRAVLTGLVLETIGIGGAFLTPWLDQFYLGVGLPGVALGLLGGTVLGISSLRRGPLPRFTAVILTLGFINEVVLSAFVYAGGAVVPMLFAWAVAGRAAVRTLRDQAQMFPGSGPRSANSAQISESGVAQPRSI
jgi:hypothetical protein